MIHEKVNYISIYVAPWKVKRKKNLNHYKKIFIGWFSPSCPINSWFFKKFIVYTKIALSNLVFATFLIHHNSVFLPN